MTLVSARELVTDAAARGTGIGAFNVIHLETAEGLVRASEAARLPVILQISQNCADYHGGLEPIALATLAVARRAQTPVAVHLDHAERPELVDEAIALGFGSVMFDGGALPYDDNVAITAAVAERRMLRASTSRASWARSAARTEPTHPVCAPTPMRPAHSWRRPASTRSPWRSVRRMR